MPLVLKSALPASLSARLGACALGLLSLLAASGAAHAAPGVGERYQVDGRCVTLSRIVGEQAYYVWSEGGRSGNGNLPAAWLGARCQAQAPAGAAAQQPKMDDDDDADADEMPHQATPPDAPVPATGAGPAPAATAAAGGDAAFRDEILRAHNQVRCMHGAPPLSWHPDVAAYAQDWVGRGGFNHSNSYRAPIGPMGENLYGSSGQPSAAAAVAAWYSESKGYNYTGEGSSSSGHFTALIWKDARYLGCARANGHLFCNYWSGSKTADCAVPNMQGCYRQEVLPKVIDEAACRP